MYLSRLLGAHRIAVIGNTSSGKSTVSRSLHERLGLPLYDLDLNMFGPGWRIIPMEERAFDPEEVRCRECWIIDGIDSLEAIERRVEAADVVVFIDHPLHVLYRWALRRQLYAVFAPQKLKLPEGCNLLALTGTVLHGILWRHRNVMPRVRDIIAKRSGTDTIIRIDSSSGLNALLSELAN